MWTALFSGLGVVGVISSAMAIPTIPEPASLSVLGLGVGALVVALRLRRRR
jgi:PEP-CTERM motif